MTLDLSANINRGFARGSCGGRIVDSDIYLVVEAAN